MKKKHLFFIIQISGIIWYLCHPMERLKYQSKLTYYKLISIILIYN